MRIAGRKEFTISEGVILFVLMGGAIAITEAVGLRQKWEDGLVYTVVLFAVVIVVLRPAWGRPRFWSNLLLLFALHVIGMIIVVSALPVGRFGIPKLFWSIALILEGFLILSVLWKRAVKSKSVGAGPPARPGQDWRR